MIGRNRSCAFDFHDILFISHVIIVFVIFIIVANQSFVYM
jgi:hypothetical protein